MSYQDQNTPAAPPQTETPVAVPPNGDVLAGDLDLPAPDVHAMRARAIDRIRLLWSNRRLLFKFMVWTLVAVTAIAFLIPSRYQSSVRLMPPDEKSGSTAILAALTSKGGSDLGLLAGDFLGMKSSGALFIGVLSSRSVQDHLINKFDLRKVYWVSLYKKARKKLSKNTEIGEDRKSGIITITVTDRDKYRAASMANEYVVELNRVVNQLNTSAAHRERVFLEDRLVQVKKDLESAEKEFSQFSSKNTAIDIKEQGKAMVEAAASLQGRLIAAQSELEGLRQIYTENNVRVKSAQARVSELKRQLDKMGGASSDNSDSQTSDSVYPSIRKLPLLGVPYADYYRRVKIQEVVYETLTKQYEMAKVQEVKETPSIKVLDQPDVPEKSSFPPRLIMVALAAPLGLIIGCAWLLGNVRWQEIDPADPRKIFVVEIYQTAKAHLPHASNGSRLAALGRIWSSSHRQNEHADNSE